MKLLQYTINLDEVETLYDYLKQFKILKETFPQFKNFKLEYNKDSNNFFVYGLKTIQQKGNWQYNFRFN